MNKRYLYAGCVVAFFVGLFLIHKTSSEYDRQIVPAGVVPHGFKRRDITLLPDEKERIVIRGSHIAVVGQDRTTTEYVPESAAVSVSIGKDGFVKLRIRHYGACFAPGVGVSFSGRWSVVLDARLAYWDRLSLLAGYNARPPTPYAGIGYETFGRTSVFVGCGNRHTWITGIRVSF